MKKLHVTIKLEMSVPDEWELVETSEGTPVLSLPNGQFLDMAIELHEIDVQAVYALALRYQLSAYDAAYLWLAAELKAPLATFNAKLATAAQAHLSTLP